MASSDFPTSITTHDAQAMRELVVRLWPVVSARVVRVLRRRGDGLRGPSRERIEDLVQEVFVYLLESDAHALKAWRSAGGLSFENFVGLLAERRVISILRTGLSRQSGLEDPTLEDQESEGQIDREFEFRLMSKDLLAELLDRLRENLAPLGMELFEALYVDQLSVAATAMRTQMTADAVYKWRERLRKLVARLALELQQESPPEVAVQGPGSAEGGPNPARRQFHGRRQTPQ
jgi:DNA-directed RNA polymerase specialized sigma24 family protein